MMSATILAIDLGQYKSVACVYRPGYEPAFAALASNPEALRRLAAWCLMRSRGALGAYLRRQSSRLGAPKALTATAHKLARIVYHLMRFGVGYMKQTETAFAEQNRVRQERQLRRRAKELGFAVTKVELPARDLGAG